MNDEPEPPEEHPNSFLDSPPRPRPPSHWPELSKEISYAAAMHRHEPETFARAKIGRFEGLGTIGEGGFGTVFKVWDPDLERVEALKLCRVDRPGADKALLEEAKILASIKHPNIIAARAVGRYGDAIFLVNEYIDGPNMYEFAIKEDQKLLRWEIVVDLFISVGETLADAHDAGIIHGDLKPENILVDLYTEETYLVDFGLARIMSPTPEQLGRESGGLGTLYYMAPDLLRGGKADRSSDQFAFAVSLWHCIEGHVPYLGDSDGLLDAIEYGAPMRWRPDVPERVYEVIRKGLSEKREDRYADMRAFVHALELARGPVLVLVPESHEQSVTVGSAPDGRPKPKGLGPVFGVMLLVGMAGVLGELYVADRAKAVDNPTTPVSERVSKTSAIETPSEDPTEPSEAAEQNPKAADIAPRGPYCVLDGAPTTDVSPELEAVCEHIRAGRIKRASDLWQGIRATLEPQSRAPDDVRRQQYIALERETRIVGETFAYEGESLKGRGGKPELIRMAQRRAAHWNLVAAGDKRAVDELTPKD